MKIMGTPSTIRDAIVMGMASPLDKVLDNMHRNVQEVIANKFQAAYIKAQGNKEALNLLKEIHGQLVRQGERREKETQRY